MDNSQLNGSGYQNPNNIGAKKQSVPLKPSNTSYNNVDAYGYSGANTQAAGTASRDVELREN